MYRVTFETDITVFGPWLQIRHNHCGRNDYPLWIYSVLFCTMWAVEETGSWKPPTVLSIMVYTSQRCCSSDYCILTRNFQCGWLWRQVRLLHEQTGYHALRMRMECEPDISKSHFLYNSPSSASVGLSPGLELLQNCTYCHKRIRFCANARWCTVPVVGNFTFGTAPWLKVEKGKCHWMKIVCLREEHSTPVTNVHKTRNGVFYRNNAYYNWSFVILNDVKAGVRNLAYILSIFIHIL
jgi:hypothetical protein